jgi:hypothetical protein
MKSLKRVVAINSDAILPKDENFVQISKIEMAELDDE